MLANRRLLEPRRGFRISNCSGTGYVAVYITGNNNTVGGATIPAQAMVITNNYYGVYITGVAGGGDNNKVGGSFIGLDSAGTPQGNTVGVTIVGAAAGNTVGGTTPAERNVISGNSEDGIRIDGASSNRVVGNYIGVNAAGTAALANSVNGIRLSNGASNNTIGGELPGERNVISGNAGSGVDINGGSPVFTLAANDPIPDLGGFIDSFVVPYSDPIVDLDVSIDITHTFDADLDIFLVPPGRPAIELTTDNGGNGDDYHVTTFDDEAPTPVTAGAAPFNGSFRPEAPLSALDGFSLSGAWGLSVTDDLAGDTGTLNSYSLRFSTGYNAVLGNYIGTDASGTDRIPNATGLSISGGSAANTIGGLTAGARNVISGNAGNGVQILTTSRDNAVLGNYIGTNATGTGVVTNGSRGVEVEGFRNTIGGTSPGARNVISGNSNRGVAFEGVGTTENLVQGNYIGVGANGATPIANSLQGVWFGSDSGGQTVGGTVAGAGNLIAHNYDQGIAIMSNNNSIYGNTVRNNGLDGIYVAGSNNRIGLTSTATAGNVITANGGDAVSVVSGTSNTIGSNSMIANGELGIDLAPNDVTANDVLDGDGGANNLQNFPDLSSSTVGGGNTVISGSLSSTPNQPFFIQYFHSNACDASGFGEGEVFMGNVIVVTGGEAGTVAFGPTFPFEVPAGRFITATATNANQDTSEFSNCIPSVNDADDDNDGFTDAAEAAIGTNPWDPCGSNGWPAELTGNDNALNIGDFNSFLFPLRGNGSFNKFGHPVPDPQDASIARWNLLVDGTINIGDLNALNPAVTSPTAAPPMFGGLPAFFTNVGNGIGGCPFPP